MPERQKILTVDDREENLFALEKTLRDTGAEIIKATSGDEALAATLHHDFALAILDVHMPGMSGFELANHLRRDEKTLSLPIIFLTATFLDEENVFKGYEAGAVDYIIKPSNPVVLNGKVKAFLELARYRKQLEDMVAERTQRLQHLNRILRKVRNVNQLIVRERDEGRLIREACKLLVEARGFDRAWIAVVDGSGNLVDIAHDGFGDGFARFVEALRSGALPSCCKEARQQRGVIVVHNLGASCRECPLSSYCGTSQGIITVLEHEGAIRGFMGLAVPATMAMDEEEQSLFQEVAGDIAYALHNIQLSKERQAAAEALRISEERLRLAQDAATAGSWEWDLRTNENFWSDEVWALFGLEPHSCRPSYEAWRLAIHPDDRAEAERAVQEAASRGTGLNIEWRSNDGNGRARWLMSRGRPVRDSTGKVMRYTGIVMDITDRKRMELALRASEVRYRRLFETAKDGILILDADTAQIMDVNPFLTELLGYSREEMREKKLWDIGLFGDVGNSRAMFAQLQTQEYVRYEDLPLQRIGGEVWDVEFVSNVYMVDGTKVIQCNIRDLTDRKKAERALQESEQRYRAVFNVASLGIDLVDRHGRFLEVNSALSEFLGHSAEELRHLTILDVTHPDDVPESRESHEAVVQGTIDQYRLEKRYRHKDGAVRWGDTAVSAIRDANGEYRATVGVVTDITARKKSEQAQSRLATAVEQAAETIEITDAQGTIVYVNPSFERTTGYSREEALENSPNILKSGQHDETFYRDLWQTISSGTVWKGHFINRKKDGTLFEEEATISPVKDRSGNIVNYVAVKRDVTKEVALQGQLFQAQKMEAIGTLAGGVAHDFNNILQVALGYSELMLSEEGLPGHYKADINKIQEAARRGADLVRRLLTFSRKTEIAPQPLNLNQRINDMRKMIERNYP